MPIHVDFHANPLVDRVFTEAAADGAKSAAQTIRVTSDADAPRAEGELVQEGRISTDGNVAAISYDRASGGIDAAWLHENTRVKFHHGHAKWLELALASRSKEALTAAAERFRVRIGP